MLQRAPHPHILTSSIPQILALVVFASCSISPEYVLLDQFFRASRLRDETALSVFSLVTFEPLEQGIVREFSVKRVTAAAAVGQGGQDFPPPLRSSETRRSGSPAAGDPPTEARRIAELSLDDPAHPIDVTHADVTLRAKEVTVDADVALPDGRTVTKTIVVTLERAIAKNPTATGRWVVTAFRQL